MSEWEKVKIGDLFFIEKGSLQSSKNIAGRYDFITAASKWKTHNSYDHECEAIVYAVAASGSLGRAHYVNGKFISSDLCFILTEKNKRKYPINFQFYQIVFEMMRDEIVSKTKTGTSKESINRGNFSNFEIPYFSIEFQQSNFQRFVESKNKIKELLEECEKQKAYVKQIRQNILQNAIEGKLTANWRKSHPVIQGNPDYDAEALFKKIQKKKASDKKQKLLPPITDEEKLFAIPEEWKWVRLGEICEGFMYGTSAKSFNEGKCPVLRMGNIQNGKIDWGKLVFTNNDEEIKKYELKIFDLLFNRTNSREMVGKTAIFESKQKTIYAGYLVRFRPILSDPYFINNILNSKTHREWCNEVKVDALGQSNINAEKLKNFIMPFPPLAEQKEIVARVEKQLQTISELEAQINDRESLTKQIMQSILKVTLRRNSK